MINIQALFAYQNNLYKTSGNKIGLEIEAHIEDLKKITPFLKDIKEDSSLPPNYKEGITYPLDLFEAFSLILYLKNNFKYTSLENLGLHIHFNIFDRNFEVSKFAAQKFKDEVGYKVKYFKKYISFFRDNNPYSNWFSKEKYHIINLKEGTIEFRAMGLKKLKDMNKNNVKKFFMFVEAFLYYIRMFNSKEDVLYFWKQKIDHLKGTYYILDPQETLEYILFGKSIKIKTLILNESVVDKILKKLEKKKAISWTFFEKKIDLDYKLAKIILPVRKIIDKNNFKNIIKFQKFALIKDLEREFNIRCVE